MAGAGFKVFIISLSIIQWIVAFVFLVAGIYVFSAFGDIKNFLNDSHTMVPASILIAAGVLLIFLGLMGVFGAIKEHKCALSIFFVLSGALFIFEFVGAIMALAMQPQFEGVISLAFNATMQKYTTDASAKFEIDTAQTKFRCCGTYNYTEWATLVPANYTMTVPISCCQGYTDWNITELVCPTAIMIAKQTPGCVGLLHDKFFGNLGVIGGVGLAFAFIQLIALIGVVYLICRRGPNYEVF